MKIKKLRNDIILPNKSYDGDAGFNLYAVNDGEIFPGRSFQMKLGIAIEIHNDEVCIISERSSQALFKLHSIGNIIDSGYRGEISIILLNNNECSYEFKKGDKIGQMLIVKLGNQCIEEVNELSVSNRGEKNHGSSGK
jgi:dUTP pyrophosphatase